MISSLGLLGPSAVRSQNTKQRMLPRVRREETDSQTSLPASHGSGESLIKDYGKFWSKFLPWFTGKPLLLGNLHTCQTKLPQLLMISLAFINREAQERKTVSKELEALSHPSSSSL